ncbi:hypothetical protein HMPREF2564_11545 [Staphylococcus sp. HMSC068D03]|uniref:Uncharacterized protein n=2 Tax=Bacillota TaxID=1239 RepID=A0A943LAH8_FINMA|nr:MULTISPECIES: hypothetical protein [Bacillota]OHP68536.1 hypothetical protein HMPREF2715_08440 [Staphylococcus sp. HMSC062A01]MBS5965334.1 hypothetical protein [Finegoldia magna]MBU6948686.1 hypothetical protein [Staphylococcus haemolyticus]MBU7211517.1 hypothetical protein [Staphylococcus haemolyticus]OHQ30155.1 hypothetical protein HMPREF2564_11545 [Staphylococcus sp. HMSC068D03]
MSKDNNNNQNIPNKKEPGHFGGGPGGEKRSNEPARKSYNNRTTEFEKPNESTMESLFGKEFKKRD